MERSEQKENRVELDFQAREEPPVITEEDRKALPEKTFSLFQWERVLLNQILVCMMIIFLLWLFGKVPGIGPGLVERFRYVLKYGENNRAEEQLTTFARKQWQKVKDEVSSWFAVEWQPVTAPTGRRIQLAAP
ncbi:MAG: hypothetical protein GX081_11590, partial [Firmicutes bacterium]|nr:hypothetical protein [Bacillota bacterium]